MEFILCNQTMLNDGICAIYWYPLGKSDGCLRIHGHLKILLRNRINVVGFSQILICVEKHSRMIQKSKSIV